MRAVLDTNVIVSALIWGGTPFKFLQAAIDGDITLYTSPALLAELRDVLARDHLAKRLAQQQTAVEEAIRLYAEMTILVTPLSVPHAVPNDIDDEQVIAVALAAEAALIVSGDADLLVLHPWQGIQILNAAEALQFVLNANPHT
jgi:putative PIN family toxin of toxin-antitoxin system